MGRGAAARDHRCPRKGEGCDADLLPIAPLEDPDELCGALGSPDRRDPGAWLNIYTAKRMNEHEALCVRCFIYLPSVCKPEHL